MCGIAGILKVHPPGAAPPPPEVAIPEVWLDILDESIKHRGPDGQGRFRDRVTRPDGSVVDVALVHRRLAIIDRAGGHQPMVSPRGRNEGEELVAVVFNGCIYNHRELRKELQAAGHRFETDHSDTEVLVHGWREWEANLFDRLDGMYALGLWDRARAHLSLARDGFGEKPLFATSDDATRVLMFGSTVAGLVKLRRNVGLPLDTPEDTIASWTKPWIQFGWNMGCTAVPTVQEITQGSAVRWPPDDSHFHLGHSLPSGSSWGVESLNPSREIVTAGQIDSLLAEAVRSRLEADVSVGCFLSGGVDSSLIAVHAAHARPDLTAFTVRMPAGVLDESRPAAAVAAHLGIRHEILECQSRPANDLASLIPQLGLPFGDSSLLPAHWVSRAARGVVQVALSGDGGDELFLGYDRHRAIRWLGCLEGWPRETRVALAEILGAPGHRRTLVDRFARLFNAAAYNGYKDLVAIFPPPLDAKLGLAGPGSYGFRAIHHWGMTAAAPDEGAACFDPSHAEFLSRLALRFDRAFYLTYDLLRKTDTASMAIALEVRAPFLQPNLARAAINAPMTSLMPRGQRKGLLRQVARKYLPAEIVDRPKQGFAIPIGDWFRTDYGGMKQLLMDHLNSTEPWGPPSLGIDLNMAYVRQMLDEHMGTGMSGRVTRDHSQRLYMLLVLSIWAKWLGDLAK